MSNGTRKLGRGKEGSFPRCRLCVLLTSWSQASSLQDWERINSVVLYHFLWYFVWQPQEMVQHCSEERVCLTWPRSEGQDKPFGNQYQLSSIHHLLSSEMDILNFTEQVLIISWLPDFWSKIFILAN